MQIAKDTVASIHYTLTSDEGEVIDTSRNGVPLEYLHGAGNLIPGLESELEGRTEGDAFQVRVEPSDGYGLRGEELVQKVPRSALPEGEIEPGMQFYAQGEGGDVLVTVVGLDDEHVTLDGNHPLAGVALNFDVSVVNVRAATEEEREHGHVHGPHGHEQ